MGSFHIRQRQNPRLYRTKSSVVTENCDGKEDAGIPRATLKETQAALLEYSVFGCREYEQKLTSFFTEAFQKG